MFLKCEVRTRFDLLKPKPESHVLERQSQQKFDHDKHLQSRQFFLGQSVMAKNPRPGPNWIPVVIVERLGPLSYLVETGDNELWRRHVDMLKSCAARGDSTSNTQSEVDYGVSSPVSQAASSETTSATPPAVEATPPVAEATTPRTSSSDIDQSNTTSGTDVTTHPESAKSVPTRSYPNRARNPPDY